MAECEGRGRGRNPFTKSHVFLFLALVCAGYLLSFMDLRPEHVASMQEEEREAYTNLPTEGESLPDQLPDQQHIQNETFSHSGDKSPKDQKAEDSHESAEPVQKQKDESQQTMDQDEPVNKDITAPPTPTPNKSNIQDSVELDISFLQESLDEANAQFEARLLSKYGSKYYPVFFPPLPNPNNTLDHSDPLGLVQISEKSVQRLLRRIQMHILAKASNPSAPAQFTWINAGHSSSAAHGNLYQQSYTAIMQQYAKPAFKAVGLEFVAKNYAMGAYAGNMELSLCLEAIYGQNFDVLSWDFGMIDGRNYFGLSLFINRLMLMAHKWSLQKPSDTKSPKFSFLPILHLIGPEGTRKEILSQAEDLGMGSVIFDFNKMNNHVKTTVPDATADENSQILLPESIAYLVCGGDIEKKQPCDAYKYKTEPCQNMKGQVGWHPGW